MDNQLCDKVILRIAEQVLNLDTLDTRNSDDLDFRDLAVWNIRAALEAAYDAGYRAAQRNTSNEFDSD